MKRVALALVVGGCQLVFPLTPTEVTGDGSPDAPLRANRVFVTSSTHTGNLGGIAGADAICAMRAAEARLPGTFIAWISDSNTAAIDRLGGSRGWVRVDNEPVADLPTDLTVRGPLSPIGMTETGDDVRMVETGVWTGTSGDGRRAPASRRCLEWTSPSTDLGRVGGSAFGGSDFTSLIEFEQCNRQNRLYCFEIGNDVEVDLAPITADGPIAFVSNTVWNAIGVSAADDLCAADAQLAGLAGTFRAALAEDGTQISSRFPRADRSYVRVDGRPVGRILADPLPTRFVLLTATATLAPVDLGIYTGAGLVEAGVAASTCNNWSDPAGTATLGSARASNASMFDHDTRACNIARPVYCLQDD